MPDKRVDDYVSRAAVIAAIEASCCDPYLKENYPNNVIEAIKQIPAADVISIPPYDPVRSGYWKVMRAYSTTYCCSKCGRVFGSKRKVCPGCGANMNMQ